MADDAVQRSIAALREYDVIVDYKGMRRPAKDDEAWAYHEWQVVTYAWLRRKQPGSRPTAAAILLYLNELVPSQQDLIELARELGRDRTDVRPSGRDAELLKRWKPRLPQPKLSSGFRETRSVRVIHIARDLTQKSLDSFDGVVGAIEEAVAREVAGTPVKECWSAKPEERKCTACDFKTFCPGAAPKTYTATVP